jgi:hypothetical protein
VFPVLLASFLLASPAAAGTLCGTVRDGASAAPLPGALVLAYLPDGSWANASAVTAGDGTFCLDVPAGTYDLQVHVNDHLVGTLKSIVVSDEVTGVEIDGVLPVLALGVYPNPARALATLTFQAPGAERVEVGVYDLRGRFVRGWSADAARAVGADIAWDFRDRDGREVPAGIYFVRLSAGSRSVVRSLVRLP